MAKVVEASAPTIPASPEPITVQSLKELYQTVHTYEKQHGKEQQFLNIFGSEKKWLSQFKPTKKGVEA